MSDAERFRPLIEAVMDEQRRQGWDDTRLASELGLHRTYVSLLRHGHRAPSRRVIGAILDRFPHLLGYLSPSVVERHRPEVRAGSGPSPPR